jgi:hypothetical protein
MDFMHFKIGNAEIPFLKYLIVIVSSWILVALAGLGIRVAEIGDLSLVPMFQSIYQALIVSLIFMTAIWLLGMLVVVLMRFGFLGGKVSR